MKTDASVQELCLPGDGRPEAPPRFGRWFCRLVVGLIGALVGLPAAGQSLPLTTDSPPAHPSARFTPSVYQTFAQWKAACDRLPSNRALRLNLPPAQLLPLKSYSEFREALSAFFELCKRSELGQERAWLEDPPEPTHFFNTDATYFLKPSLPFQPFVERRLVPPGTKLVFHGDFHGDIHSFVAWLDWLHRQGWMRDFQITRPEVFLVFLGDYTDRGIYGMEVLYTILRLKLANPQQVLMVRGNHEDVNLAARYGFIAEGRGKYGREFDGKRVMRMYDFLPVVLYLGTGANMLQCNHGGMEPGFDPRQLLDAPTEVAYQQLGRLTQQQFLRSHSGLTAGFPKQTRRLMENSLLDFQPETPTSPLVIGFMWNDFSVVKGEAEFDYDPGRAFVYGETVSKYLLQQFSTPGRRLQAVFRAHQHATILNGMMRRLKAGKGVYRHWQERDSVKWLEADLPVIAGKIDVSSERSIPPGSVWTFNVGPDSVYGESCDFSFDTFGILTTAEKFEDWRLQVVNQTVKK